MTVNSRTAGLQALGQSLWLDYMKRGILDGELQSLIADRGVTGITSNPTIFEKAISSGTDYDAPLRIFAEEPNPDPKQLFERLSISDIQRAADILRPVYERTSGQDGFVSIEVSPELANDTNGTLVEARRLWLRLERPNVMIKIPGTPAGVPAIKAALTEGININVTLLFSVRQYEAVADAHLDALQARLRAGQPIDRVASVASFFVSRVDTLCNQLIDEAVNAKKPTALKLAGLRGRIGIANSKLAYQKFIEITGTPRWRALATNGARPQRVLWASTSMKDPKERDVLYVEALAGPGTVNTLPPETLAAFADHGEAAPRLTTDVDAAREEVARLEAGGISLDALCEQLQREGVKKFTDSIVSARQGLADKVAKLRAAAAGQPRPAPGATDYALGPLEGAALTRLETAAREKIVARLWERDVTLWKSEAKHQDVARHRLGWLDVAEKMVGELPRLSAFAGQARKDGFTHAVVLGMGGSSLAPDVFRQTFGAKDGALKLHVLDSTAPGAVRAVEAAIDLGKTLFVVSSKSGGTIEPNSFFQYFHKKVTAAVGAPAAGAHFAGITDPGSGLEKLARAHAFRDVFLNPSDIGGRYSALSFFGLVPAALAGVDLDQLLERAIRMAWACRGEAASNPGLRLGVALGEAARAGRDKLTLLAPPELRSFGGWAEQLIAESTGKEGKGLVPIDQEPLGEPSVYGDDRLFAALAGKGSPPASPGPGVVLHVPELLDLGAEFFRWEFATAVAGWLLGIDPFDEPNVQESKDNTARILMSLRDAPMPQTQPTLSADGLGLWADGKLAGGPDVASLLKAFFAQAPAHGYVALQAFIAPDPALWAKLTELRGLLRDRTKLATTVGWGPRFLHSTGQLHKGGPQTGTFVQLTADPGDDIAIPGVPYEFAQLLAAQAEGDLKALRQRTPRVLRVNLGADPAVGMSKLIAAAEKALPKK